MLGKLYIYDKINCDQLNYIVNISELPIGTYIVTVDRSDRIPVQSKLVVIR